MPWAPNFVAILACQFVIFISFSAVMPFMPLYLRALGEDEASAIAWTGAIHVLSSIALLVTTPLWGALSDRVGRKPMVVRALLSAMIGFLLLAVTTQSWQVLAVRVIQGITSGTNAAVIALAAAVLPPARLGMGMGLLQTAQFLGVSTGPLLGGLGVAFLGFRGTFVGSAIVMAVVVIAVAMTIREPPLPLRESISGRPAPGLLRQLSLVAQSASLRWPLLTILGFQTGYIVSWLLISLHLDSLLEPGIDPTPMVGAVFTANALGVATGASALGWAGGRVSARAVAVVSLLATALLTLPQTWLADPVYFIPLRFVLGFCAGGVLPALRTSLGEEAAKDPATKSNVGAVYGLAQSAFSAGMTVGPLFASVAATAWGLPSVHLVGAGVLVITAAAYMFGTRRRQVPSAA